MPFVNGTWVDWTLIVQNTTNVTNIQEAMTYINSVTGYWFGYMILLMVFMVVFIAGSRYGSSASLATSLFITTITGYLLAGFGMVGQEAIVPLTLALVGAIILIYKGGGSGV